MNTPGRLFSVVAYTHGDALALEPLLAALVAQTLPRERFELLLALDGAPLEPALAARVAALGTRVARPEPSGGPGAARNAAAALAEGEWLAFTADDVAPAADWLERAAACIASTPEPDVLEGVAQRAGGGPVRLRPEAGPQYDAATLFVRRDWFARVGGFDADYFEPARGTYFRAEADLGFKLEEANAVVVRATDVHVTRPDAPAGPWEPVRWAARHELDPLLEHRHPRLFAQRIDVQRVGPFRVRRPLVRACTGIVLCAVLAAGMALAGRTDAARVAVLLALALHLPLWAKWRCSPLHLPAVLVAPWAMTLALARGTARAARLEAERKAGRA